MDFDLKGRPDQQGGQQGLNLSLKDTEAYVCDECGHDTFLQTFKIRMVSAVYSPAGQESLMPIPVFECSSCGHVNNSSLPHDLQTKEDNTSEI